MARSVLVWQIPPSVIAVRVTAVGPLIRVRLAKALQRFAAQAQDEMKTGAPWTDRTGAARASLTARANISATEGVITLSHGVDYGIWLEVANQGRYAIVGPTVASFGPKVMAGLGGML